MNITHVSEEAARCLQCKNARCSASCPISTMIPDIINLYLDEKIEEAGEMLFENNPLSLICSLVCPHEDQCLGNCIMGIKGDPVDFPKIERTISRNYLENGDFSQKVKLKDKIAIVGSGPAGITMAFILARKGYQVTIFERHSKLGGVLRYGIPEFRLSKDILDLMEKRLLEMGVKIRYNDLIGPVTNVDKLLADGYSAIFIGTGVWNPRPLGIKGETFGHVHYAINYLRSPDSFQVGKKVAVIGAGNVAMDAARTAKRAGADVTVLYRRGVENMSATKLEINETMEDGVEFQMFSSPVEITDDGVVIVKTETFEDADGKKGLRSIEESENLFQCDTVIIAVSQSPKDNIVSRTKNIQVGNSGLVVTDEKGHTTRDGIFASGDVVTGAKTVVEAVANTKIVAENIDQYCKVKREAN